MLHAVFSVTALVGFCSGWLFGLVVLTDHDVGHSKLRSNT